MFQKIKDWLIRKLGGRTAEEYGSMVKDYLWQIDRRNAQIDQRDKQLAFVRRRCSELDRVCLEQNATLNGLKVLEAKIETFRAEGAFPNGGRSGIQLQRRIADKKTAVVNKLVSDILQQNRFFVIEVNEESNKVKVSATISVLEGGVISGETQLPKNSAGEGGSRESGETP